MKMSDIAYYFGYATQIFIRSFVYVAVPVGFVMEVYNRNIPYLPVLLLIAYMVLKWVALSLTYLQEIFIRQQKELTAEDIVHAVNVVNYKNSIGLGPN